jgi:hypothetical protein
VSGQTPIIEGWEVAAVLQHAEDGPHMAQATDPEIAKAYRHSPPDGARCNLEAYGLEPLTESGTMPPATGAPPARPRRP